MPLRILFSIRNPSYVRHYESVLRLLAGRGHEVALVTEPTEKQSWPGSVLRLVEDVPRIQLSLMPALASDPWFELATRLRQARFYLRFLDPKYGGMPALGERARSRAPALTVRLAESAGLGGRGRRLIARVIDVLERATCTSRAFYPYLREMRPDVVVATPLVVLKTTQLDLMRAAIELGIRNVFAVASWDNLSSKGELTFAPQQLVVWNALQQQEAAELHEVDPARVVVTGAQVFDEWFDKRPSTSREAFCARVGLRPDRPLVLYVCSALLEGSPPEPRFVEQWVRHLRSSTHPVLRDCNILIRPHFKRGDEWKDVTVTTLDGVVCWPPLGAVPADRTSKTDYFDSMHHADAVVGLNTSAMIEAAIVGRPVYTVLLPQFRDSQEGTVHFHYLLEGPDALLHAARSFDQHAEGLSAQLEHRAADPERSARFVRMFVRPGPMDCPATVRFADAIEALAGRPAPSPEPAPVWAAALRPWLAPFARAAARRVRRIRDEHRRNKEAQLEAHRTRKAQAKRPAAERPRSA